MLEPSPDSSCFKKKCTLSYFVVFFTQPLLLPFSFLYVSFQDMRLLGTGQPLCTKSFWEIQLCQTGSKHRPMLVRSPPLTTKWTLKLLGHGLPSLYDFPFVTWSRQHRHTVRFHSVLSWSRPSLCQITESTTFLHSKPISPEVGG